MEFNLIKDGEPLWIPHEIVLAIWTESVECYWRALEVCKELAAIVKKALPKMAAVKKYSPEMDIEFDNSKMGVKEDEHVAFLPNGKKNGLAYGNSKDSSFKRFYLGGELLWEARFPLSRLVPMKCLVLSGERKVRRYYGHVRQCITEFESEGENPLRFGFDNDSQYVSWYWKEKKIGFREVYIGDMVMLECFDQFYNIRRVRSMKSLINRVVEDEHFRSYLEKLLEDIDLGYCPDALVPMNVLPGEIIEMIIGFTVRPELAELKKTVRRWSNDEGWTWNAIVGNYEYIRHYCAKCGKKTYNSIWKRMPGDEMHWYDSGPFHTHKNKDSVCSTIEYNCEDTGDFNTTLKKFWAGKL